MFSFEPIDFSTATVPEAARAQAHWHPDELGGSASAISTATAAARREQEARDAEAAAAQARADALDAMYAQGVADGRAEGEAAEAARLRSAVAATSDALDALRAGELAWTQHIEENLAALGVAIAQQIIGRDVSASPDVVRGIVERTLAEFPVDQALVVRLHPADCALVSAMDIVPDPDVRAVRYVADARIHPGGCLVEGRDRIVDGRVDTALERLYRRLTYTNA